MRSGARVEFYRDADKQWRWRAWNGGRVVADSGQGYSRRIDAVTACRRLLGAWRDDLAAGEGYPDTFRGWFRRPTGEPDEWEAIPYHYLPDERWFE